MTESIAVQVVCQIRQEFPGIEIQTFSPEDFFDGYFTEVGYPADGSVFPIWHEPGQVIYIEDPEAFRWNNEMLNFATPSNPDEGQEAVIIFLHESGFVGIVEEGNGELHPLLRISESRVLADYVKLFFRAGREHLASVDRPEPALLGIEVPFFYYPDDYCENPSLMPTISASIVRDLILTHVNEGLPWLCALESLDASIKKTREKFSLKQRSLELPVFDFQDEGITGWEWFLQILEEENHNRAKNRPHLLEIAAALDESLLVREPADPLHATNRLLPYAYINKTHPFDGLKLPIRLLYNKGVFAPYLEEEIDPLIRRYCAEFAGNHIRGNKAYQLPMALSIPTYLEQVELALIQWACILQAPRITQRLMSLPSRGNRKAEHRANLRKQMIQQLRSLLAQCDK